MDDDKRKPVMIGIIITCIVLAVGVTICTSTGGGTDSSDTAGSFLLLCTECNESFKMSRNELRTEMLQATGGAPVGVVEQTPAIACKSCGKNAAQLAIKCKSKSCEAVFIRDPQADFCPECGYSDEENRN